MLKRLLLIIALLPCLGFGQTPYDKAKDLLTKADSIRYSKDGLCEDAIRLYQEASSLFELTDSIYDVFRCKVAIAHCKHYLSQLDLSQTKELVEQITKAGISDTLLGNALFLQGARYMYEFMFDSAIWSYQLALPLVNSSRTDRRIMVPWYLAYTHSSLQESDLAIYYYRRALDNIQQLSPDNRRKSFTFKLLVALMEEFSKTGDYRNTLRILLEAKALLDEDSLFGKEEESYFLSTAGSAMSYLGDMERARDYIEESLDMGWTEEAQLNLAVVLSSMQDYHNAIKLNESLLEKEIKTINKVLALANIADEYTSLDRPVQGLSYAQQSVAFGRSVGLNRPLVHGYIALADAMIALDRFAEAREGLAEALTVAPNVYRTVYLSMANLFSEQGKFDSATHYAELALFDSNGEIVLGQGLGYSFPELLVRAKTLLKAYESAGRNSDPSYLHRSIDACSILHRYMIESQEIYADASFKLSERTSFIYEQGIRHGLLLAEVLDQSGYISEAFQFSEWSKVHALQRARKSADARLEAGLPAELLTLESELRLEYNFLKAQVDRLRSGPIQDSMLLVTNESALRDINIQQDSLRSVFSAEYPKYHQLMYEDISIPIQELQNRLEPQQAFLEYYVGDTTSFLFVITPDNYAVHPLALHQDSLISELREFFQPETFEQPAQAYYDKAYDIYQAYLSPAIESLSPSISELIVVPDGKLSYVPFEVLLQEAHQSDNWSGPIPYLLRDYQIHYTYSAGLYFNEFTSLSSNDRFLAFAPDYATTLSDTVTLNGFGAFRNQITPLKYNREEVKYLQQTFDGLGFVNETATERNFKQHLDDNAGILHLAMHTILDDEDPLQSRLIFTNTEDSVEDDQLHAYEIYNMRVPAQLTVLSACETGFGQLAKGEGALSLARAFAYAGSPSVVMSHWPVDDEVTAQVMQSFYDYLAEGYTKSEALRQAKLDYLDKGLPSRMHPFFWGSFVVMGDDNALALSTKWGWKTYALWVLMLSVVAVGMIRWIRPGFAAGRRS